MRPVQIAVTLTLIAVLGSSAIAAVTRERGIPQFTAVPVRAHVALGPVAVVAAPVSGSEEGAPSLARAARERYGHVDGLATVRCVPLPGSDRGLITGIAFRWE